MEKDLFDFTGRCVLITGAASGMGKAACLSFAQHGASVVVVDINQEGAAQVASEITAAGGKAIAVKADVQKYADIENAVNLGIATFGSMDVTISFAGGEPARMLHSCGNFAEQSPDLIDWGLAVNGRAPIYVARAVINQMLKQNSGVIINIGSVDGVMGGALVYSAAKSGLIGFTKSLAQYGASHGIRACCISPGPVLTRPQMAKMKTLLGRASEPQEIVNMAMYLASDLGRSITGTNFCVDNGRTSLYTV